MATVNKALHNFYTFFKDGFTSMTIGKILWTIVLIKLLIMFGILRVFFFPNLLNSNFDDDETRADYVRSELIDRAHPYNE